MLRQEAKEIFQMHSMITNIKVEDVVNSIGWTKKGRERSTEVYLVLTKFEIKVFYD